MRQIYQLNIAPKHPLTFLKGRRCIHLTSATKQYSINKGTNVSIQPQGMYFEVLKIPEVLTLQESFDNLPQDIYRPGQHRRFNRVVYYPGQDRVEIDPDSSFYQSRSYNAFNQGQIRHYKPLEMKVIQSEGLRTLLTQFSNHVAHNDKLRRQMLLTIGTIGQIHIFQIRTTCLPRHHPDYDKFGVTVPEGVHRDGMDYIGITCIRRKNVKGGNTALYYEIENEPPFIEMELGEGFCVLLNDEQVYHYVSDIQSKDNESEGVRDVLILALDSLI